MTTDRTDDRAVIGVGQVGYAFMGAAHSQAWRTAPRFFDLPAQVDMRVLVGRDGANAARAAHRLGWQESATDWRALLTRDDVHLVDICSPGNTHAEIAIAALEAGKHVLCEKPLANSVAEAEAMAAAARAVAAHGVVAMCGFTYRRVPAVQLMAALVAQGAIGTLRHVRAVYLQDWLMDPQAPMSWRLERSTAGSGALGDIAAHIVDMAQFVSGDHLTSVSGHLRTFVDRRPLPTGGGFLGTTASGSAQTAEVTVDDTALFLATTSSGAVATFEASRFATGHKNGLRLELNGSAGALAFDLERLNELQVYDATADNAGFRTVLVTEPSHPYVAAWWPPGHMLGYEHAFSHQVVDLVEGIVNRTPVAPTFDDALQVQRVLDAVETSATGGGWVDVPAPDLTPATTA